VILFVYGLMLVFITATLLTVHVLIVVPLPPSMLRVLTMLKDVSPGLPSSFLCRCIRAPLHMPPRR
jgi:hypothetical protein